MMQMKSKYVMAAITFLSVWFVTCRQEAGVTDINGKKVASIMSNVIMTSDSARLTLDEDSITKIFYLVRHAEKDTSVKVEPPLTDQGLQRAARLADILRGTRVDAIYSTMTVRTMFTADSLADIKAMTILPYDNKNLKGLIDTLSHHADFNRVLIVGHSNTIPAITNTLAGRDVFTKTFDENEYDNFVVVVGRKSGKKDVYTLKY